MVSMFSSEWTRQSLVQVNKQLFNRLVVLVLAELRVRLTAPCQHFNARNPARKRVDG